MMQLSEKTRMRWLPPVTAMGAALLLAACGGGSGSVPVTTVPPAPTATLTANPTTVAGGGTSTLTWSSANATSCTASGGTFAGSKATGGSQPTGMLTSNTTYSLTCTGIGGTSPVASTAVNIIPTALLTATPPAVPSGGASTLAWSSTNAASCMASGAWGGARLSSGTQSTGPLAASTTYSLVCTGPGGTSTAATATVTPMTVSPTLVGLTVSQAQQITATVPGGGLAAWTVDGVAGGNAAVGLIDATGLYTAGTAPGTHTILATSQADSTLSATAVAAVTDLAGVYTYHNDPGRDGANVQEYALTPATVTGGKFGKLASCAVDGAIYGQPLWVANLAVSGVKHNAVFVATQHDSLYAFDADSSACAQIWSSVSLVDTAHGANAGETSVPTNVNLPLVGGGNGDIQPEIGVTSTPVIDPANGILYVLAKSVNAGHTIFYQRLHAIDLASGAEKTGSPVLISGTYPGTGDGTSTVTFDPQQEGQRPGLALVNGTVYIAWAGHGDFTPFYGWMMGYTYNGSSFTQSAVFNTAPNTPYQAVPAATGGAGIWMSGAAPAADSNNNLYVLTGNGPFDADMLSTPHNDYGDSMLQLNTALTVSQYFTPTNQALWYPGDTDFGSGGALIADLPAGSPVPHLIIGGGKDTHFYVLNRDALGGFGDGNAIQVLFAGGAIHGTGAFWNDFFYISGEGGPLNAFSVTPTSPQPLSVNPVWSSPNHFARGGGTASISAAANSNGIAWVLDNGNFCTNDSPGCGAAVLYAYDATNVSTLLWNSGAAPLGADQAGNAVKFTVPTIANGKIYIGTRGNNTTGSQSSTTIPGELDIYGLKP
jgi:hypothetical protein